MNKNKKSKFNLTGQCFGQLRVIGPANRKGKGRYWTCICDCGKTVVIRGSSLRSGNTRSCGCLRNGEHLKTHGQSRTKEYRAWSNVKSRCLNPNTPYYVWYGGRGISMWEPWQDNFETFFQHNGQAAEGRSLDRINNYDDYRPGNTRWATALQQQRNKPRKYKARPEWFRDGSTITISAVSVYVLPKVTGKCVCGRDIRDNDDHCGRAECEAKVLGSKAPGSTNPEDERQSKSLTKPKPRRRRRPKSEPES